MSAHVLLKSLNELGKSDKMRDLFCFRKMINTLSNTRAQM